MSSPLNKYLDEIDKWVEAGFNNPSIVKRLEELYGVLTSETAVRRAKKKLGNIAHKSENKRSVKLEGDTAEIESSSTQLLNPDDILLEAGLDPLEWTVERYRTSTRQTIVKGETVDLHQVGLTARRSAASFIRAAAGADPRYPGKCFAPPENRHNKNKKPILIGIMPDMHCPLEEPVLCDGFAAWAKEFQPDKIINLGDGHDASAFGRHPKNPKYDHSAQEGIDGYYYRLRQQREAAPNAEIVILPGNHDYSWLQRRVLENIPNLYGLRKAASDEEVLSLPHLLRLDELQIEFVDPDGGEYHESTYLIAEDLTIMHGNMTGEYGGATKEAKTWEGSVGQGHDHKLALVAVTRRLPDGTEVQRYAISFGTASTRSLGYDPRRNVNQGFGVIVLHSDGRWHPEFATYCPQRNDVCFRDWRYSV